MAALAGRIEDDVTALSRRLAGRQPLPAGELQGHDQRHAADPPADAAVRATSSASARTSVSTSCVGNQALNLSKRDADVAIRASDHPPETLVGRRVARIAWALYGSARDFPDAEPPGFAATASPGAGSPSATISRGMKAARFVRDHVPPERIVYKVNTVLGLAEAIEAGAGIGHLPCFIADRRPGLVRLGPARPGVRGRPLAADPPRPSPIGAGSRISRLSRCRHRPAAAVDRGCCRPAAGVGRCCTDRRSGGGDILISRPSERARARRCKRRCQK